MAVHPAPCPPLSKAPNPDMPMGGDPAGQGVPGTSSPDGRRNPPPPRPWVSLDGHTAVPPIE
eukprot:10134666-Alexandrium_andersonii.AAC.1